MDVYLTISNAEFTLNHALKTEHPNNATIASKFRAGTVNVTRVFLTTAYYEVQIGETDFSESGDAHLLHNAQTVKLRPYYPIRLGINYD